MSKRNVSVLLVSGEQQQPTVEPLLSTADGEVYFEVHRVSRLSEVLPLLDQCHFDLILLAFILPDKYASMVVKIKSQVSKMPLVVLGEAWSTAEVINLLRDGVQDVLARENISASVLKRSLLYAIERQKLLSDLENAALFDELTGLYNRRGFMNIAAHYLKVAERSRQGAVLYYADLDSLKSINDCLGHQAGDQAILSCANILKAVFRNSDIVARIGGDEFVILALDADVSFAEIILKRLQDKESEYSDPCKLSLSIGFAYCDPDHPHTIEELLEQADQSMYISKLQQKKQRDRTSARTTCAPTCFPG